MVTETTESNGRIGELLHRITDDVKTIAKDEIELAKGEVQHTAKVAATEAAVVVLGGIVALIGLGMLCATAVAALALAIPALWARLLIMAIVYLAIGGLVAGVFTKRLKRDAVPDLKVPAHQAKRTVTGVKEALRGT